MKKLFSIMKNKWRDYSYWSEQRCEHFKKPWFVHFPQTRAYMKATRAYFKFGVPISLFCTTLLIFSFFNSSISFFLLGLTDITIMFLWTFGMLCWEQFLKHLNERRELTLEQGRASPQSVSQQTDHAQDTNTSSHLGLSLSLSEKEGLIIEELVADIFSIQKNHLQECKDEQSQEEPIAKSSESGNKIFGNNIETEKERERENEDKH
jgi:hypothetical protein